MSSSTRIIVKGQREKGFSLIEMMVSMAVSLIAMSGIIALFAGSVGQNTESLRHVRLNQELRAIMDVMVRDIRRAGYWANADGVTANPFQPANAAVDVNIDNDCIVYSYDNDDDGVLDPEEAYGFRLNGGAVEIRQNGNDCDPSNAWPDVSDANVVSIDALTFNILGANDLTFCTNLTSGATSLNSDTCVGAASGDVLSKMYVVDVTLTGSLLSDSDVNLTLDEKVVVRNTVSLVEP